MLDPLPRRYTVCSRLFLPRCHRPSPKENGLASRSYPACNDFVRGRIFEVADISLCSGLQVCSPPRSSLPLRILPQGSRGFYVRAERGSLPPRASDMLAARRQAIGGAGTSTPLDCGLVGCSFPRSPLSFRTAGFPQYGWKAGFSGGVFPHCYRFKPAPGVHRQPSGLRSPFVHLIVTAVVPHCVGPWTRLRTALEVITPPPQGPSLGPGCSVPVRRHLIGPIRPT